MYVDLTSFSIFTVSKRVDRTWTWSSTGFKFLIYIIFDPRRHTEHGSEFPW